MLHPARALIRGPWVLPAFLGGLISGGQPPGAGFLLFALPWEHVFVGASYSLSLESLGSSREVTKPVAVGGAVGFLRGSPCSARVLQEQHPTQRARMRSSALLMAPVGRPAKDTENWARQTGGRVGLGHTTVLHPNSWPRLLHLELPSPRKTTFCQPNASPGLAPKSPPGLFPPDAWPAHARLLLQGLH